MIKRSKPKQIGKKTRQWNNTRRKLKVEFTKMGIQTCEQCGSTFALSFSHRFKRRFITDETELMTVVLLCGVCHTNVENHPDKVEIHNRLIENRGLILCQ